MLLKALFVGAKIVRPSEILIFDMINAFRNSETSLFFARSSMAVNFGGVKKELTTWMMPLIAPTFERITLAPLIVINCKGNTVLICIFSFRQHFFWKNHCKMYLYVLNVQHEHQRKRLSLLLKHIFLLSAFIRCDFLSLKIVNYCFNLRKVNLLQAYKYKSRDDDTTKK